MAGDPRHHDYTKEPRHPVGLIPTDFDFGRVIEKATGDDPSSAKPWPRYYEEGVKSFLQCVWQFDGRAIPVVKASPKNAWSEYADLLVNQKILERTDEGSLRTCPAKDGSTEPNRISFNVEQFNQFPLPYVSFHDLGHQLRDGHNTNFPVRNMRFVDTIESKTNQAMRGITYMRYPTPMTIPFQVELWAKYEQHLKWLVDQMEARFWDYHAHHAIEHPLPYPRSQGERMLMPIKLAGSTNNTELERGTEGDKIMRWTFEFEVEAWAFYDELLAPTVQILGEEFATPDEEELGEAVERLTDLAPVPLSQQDPNTEAPEETVS